MEDDPFLDEEGEHKVVAAIAAAELRTSAEIRVLVTHQRVDDALHSAHAALQRLGMTRTTHRNAVLILVSPTSRKFAVAGDVEAHKKIGDQVWRALAERLSDEFAAGRSAAALAHVIGQLAGILARDFPHQAGDTNELPDEIVRE